YYLSGDSKGQWRKSFMDLNTCNEKLYAFNNIFTTVNDGPNGASDPQISIFRSRGAVSEFENNIVSDITKSWYNDKTDGDPCSFGLDFTIIENSMQSFSDISFTDADNGDYTLTANSVAKDAGKMIPGNLIPVKHQFKSPNGIKERKDDGAIDVGAFEY
ncbi:MAG: hypothetical protein MI922_14200, partial [Bacteroidales bacterium]|nr:hypothetical protein [Bacteroidales bacterium]